MNSGGQVLCPGCLDAGPRLTGACSVCGAARQLRGRYWIEAVLRRGGPCRILRARDGVASAAAAGPTVALVEHALDRARAREEGERFDHAERALRDLDGVTDGIARTLDHFVWTRGGVVHHYFVREWIEGRSLAAHIAERASFDEASARVLADELLTTLAALHGLRPPVLHGDIRPATIIDRGERAARGDGRPRHLLVGLDPLGAAPRPGYAPLEQLLGRPTPASDLHALGATLIASLSGEEPSALIDPTTQRFDFAGRVQVSAAFIRWLGRLVAPTPAERFASAEEARRSLTAEASEVDSAGALVSAEAIAVDRPPAASARPGALVLASIAVGLVAVGLTARAGAAIWPIALIALAALFALHRVRRAPAPAQARAPRRPPLRPTSDDALVVEVGRGLAGIVVGESSVADVLATFGDDCTCSCYDRGSIPGPEVAADPGRPSRIWRISYDYDALERYEPSRPVNARRPSAIEIDGDTGVVKQLDFGVYQRAIATREGLRVDSTLADMIALYGDDHVLTRGEHLDQYRYAAGIEVWVSPASDEVNSFRIRAPQGRDRRDATPRPRRRSRRPSWTTGSRPS